MPVDGPSVNIGPAEFAVAVTFRIDVAFAASACRIAARCPARYRTTRYIDPKRYGDGELCGPNIHGGPIYWHRGATSGTIFEMPEKDFLKGFHYDPSTGHVNQLPALQATEAHAQPPTDGMPGGCSSLSANGTKDGISGS